MSPYELIIVNKDRRTLLLFLTKKNQMKMAIKLFEKNLGITDRIIRFVIFDLLVGASLAGMAMPIFAEYLAFFGFLYLLITLVIGFDPFYYFLGINTKDVPKHQS